MLAKGEVLKGELGTGAESRAQGGEQVQEEGEHRQLAHDATGRMPHLRIPEFTDGRTVLRMNTWRRTRVFPAGFRAPLYEPGVRLSLCPGLAESFRPLRWNTCSRQSARMTAEKPTVASYRSDPLYPRIAQAVDDLLRRDKVVTPVDVLIAMGLLTRDRLEDWRHGRVPFLEQVIHCSLTRLGRLLRIQRFHAHDLNLKPSWTAYMRWGKGPKQRLRFTKTGDPKVEEAYATHFVWTGKVPFHERATHEASR